MQQINRVAVNAESPITSPITSPEHEGNNQEIPQETTPTPTPTETPNNNQSTGGSNGSADYACGDPRPVHAPTLTGAYKIAPTRVMLVWQSAGKPVSHYVIAYSTKTGTIEYATAPISGGDLNVFTVEKLMPNQTYIFKVRGGNGCMPSDWSNEISPKQTFLRTNTLTVMPNILATATTSATATISAGKYEDNSLTATASGFITKIANFFGSLFNH